MIERPDFDRIADTTRMLGDRTAPNGRRYSKGNRAGLDVALKRGALPSAIASSQRGIEHRADDHLRRFSWEDGA
jgi:hypothetical protein